jgi:hypothetical protein
MEALWCGALTWMISGKRFQIDKKINIEFKNHYSGRCGSGKFPLLSALNTELEGYKVDLEYDGPYESYNPRGKYTTKDREFILNL